MTKARTIREIVSFAAVGVFATLTHIAAAWFAYDGFGLHPAIANLLGAIAAFFVSFFLNATATFQAGRPGFRSGLRYLMVSFISYLLCTGIMLIVEWLNLATYVFALAVLAMVPPTTFVLAKFWVFESAADNVSDDRCNVPCA